MSLLKYFKKTPVPSSGRETASAGDEKLGVLVMRELGVLVMRELGVLLQAYRNLVKPVQVT